MANESIGDTDAPEKWKAALNGLAKTTTPSHPAVSHFATGAWKTLRVFHSAQRRRHLFSPSDNPDTRNASRLPHVSTLERRMTHPHPSPRKDTHACSAPSG